MDFSRLPKPSVTKPAVNPLDIFARLPRVASAPNDLWRGQAAALEGWHQRRAARDVVLSLNTGSGKTIIGLLIAQSLVNERIENVLYCCATIDLVRQTALEAERIGIKHTTRTGGDFDNDLFESGNAFCITTYQALFNGRSTLRRRFPPGAVIFDDAHVAEGVIRDALTIRIEHRRQPDLLRDVAALFEPHFAEIGFRSRFLDAVQARGFAPPILLTPPTAVRTCADQLAAVLARHGVPDDGDLSFPFAHIKDKLDRMAVVFGPGVCEITPAFLPSLALDVFERPIRRVYLSATLKSKTEFIRAFGRKPSEVVEPSADAGNGERLILFSRVLATKGFGTDLVRQLAPKHKVLVAVPTYQAAQAWAPCGTPPDPKGFTESLNAFRRSSAGTFILVQRTDGIDLPHAACRVMVLDGMPSGSSMLERYQYEFLNMRASYASRMANRIVQLFGRINRGRNDYGVFLVDGRPLNAWLHNHRYVALLPPLLRNQILLGQSVQDGMSITTRESVVKIVAEVLDRNPSWVNHYGSFLEANELEAEEVERATNTEAAMEVAAEAEARVGAAIWSGDYDGARRALEGVVEATARADALSAGWQLLWLGAAYEALGDVDAARVAFRDARGKLGSHLTLPVMSSATGGDEENAETLSAFGANVYRLVIAGTEQGFSRQLTALRGRMGGLDGASPRQMEEAVRELGQMLGFTAERPDNDVATGPDVLWRDENERICVGFELKTDKVAPGRYNKKEIGQGHDHLTWMAAERKEYRCLGLIYVGPDGACTADANPAEGMTVTLPKVLADLRDQVFAVTQDCRRALPIARYRHVRDTCSGAGWQLSGLFERVKGRPLRKA
jgi:hypothetical protein